MAARTPTLLIAALAVTATAGCRLISPKTREYMRIELSSGVVTQNQVVPLDRSLPRARLGDRLWIHYTASLTDGSVVDSSRDLGVPVEFVLGDEALPLGLEQGLYGMRLRGERLVTVPPQLAYGAEGIPGMVPPDSTIDFLVELVQIEQRPYRGPSRTE